MAFGPAKQCLRPWHAKPRKANQSVAEVEARGVTLLFIRDYPGAAELAYDFRCSTAELYGPRATETHSDVKGRYIYRPIERYGRTYFGRADVPLEKVADVHDLLVAGPPGTVEIGRGSML